MGLNSEGPFFTERFRPNLHCLNERRNRDQKQLRPEFATDRFRSNLRSFWTTGRECSTCCLDCPSPMRGEIERKNCFGLKSKVPFLPTHFDQTCTASSPWAVSTMFDVSVTPLQWEARLGRKTVSARRVKCPPLLTEFTQTCTASKHGQGVHGVLFQSPLSSAKRHMEDKLFRPHFKVPFLTDRFRPNMHCFKPIGREYQV
jgi:hypothetical protein